MFKSKLNKWFCYVRYWIFVLIIAFAFQSKIEAQNEAQVAPVFMLESKYNEALRKMDLQVGGTIIGINKGTTIYETDNPDRITTKINAEFPEGKEAREKFMEEHVVYPQKIEHLGLLGIVDVKFFVEANGTLSEPNIASTLIVVPDDKKTFESYPGEDPATNFQEAALNVVKQMPNWTPAKLQNDKTVRSEIRLQMKFVPKTSGQ